MLQRALCALTIFGLLLLPGTRAAGQPAPSGPRVQVAQLGAPYSFDYAVAALPDGGFTVAWTAQDGVRVRGYQAGGAPRSETVRFLREREATAVDMAFNRTGTGFLVWVEAVESPDSSGAFGCRIDAEGRPAGEILRLDSGESGFRYRYTHSAHVVVDPAGDFVVAWTVGTDEGSFSHLRRIAASGAVPGPDHVLPALFPFDTLSLASSPSGGFAVAGLADADSGSRVVLLLRLGSDLKPIGEVIRVVSGERNGTPYAVRSAFEADGHLQVVWVTYEILPDRTFLFRRRFTPGGAPAGPAVRMIEGGRDPWIAPDPEGGFLVAWTAGGKHFAQRIEPSGARGPRSPARTSRACPAR